MHRPYGPDDVETAWPDGVLSTPVCGAPARSRRVASSHAWPGGGGVGCGTNAVGAALWPTLSRGSGRQARPHLVMPPVLDRPRCAPGGAPLELPPFPPLATPVGPEDGKDTARPPWVGCRRSQERLPPLQHGRPQVGASACQQNGGGGGRGGGGVQPPAPPHARRWPPRGAAVLPVSPGPPPVKTAAAAARGARAPGGEEQILEDEDDSEAAAGAQRGTGWRLAVTGWERMAPSWMIAAGDGGEGAAARRGRDRWLLQEGGGEGRWGAVRASPVVARALQCRQRQAPHFPGAHPSTVPKRGGCPISKEGALGSDRPLCAGCCWLRRGSLLVAAAGRAAPRGAATVLGERRRKHRDISDKKSG